MALGKRKHEQQEAWVATTELPKSPGHPFYRRLNQLLAEAGFDAWLEALCRPYYAEQKGRPSIPPGTYFRMILIGYFEGIASQRGIAWRCCDSRSLAEFLGCGPTEETPDHSSLTRIHQRLPQEVHEAMFTFVLALAAEKKLLAGTTVAVDSTMLEANAAMKSIGARTRAKTGRSICGLAEEAGIANPPESLGGSSKSGPAAGSGRQPSTSFKTDLGCRWQGRPSRAAVRQAQRREHHRSRQNRSIVPPISRAALFICGRLSRQTRTLFESLIAHCRWRRKLGRVHLVPCLVTAKQCDAAVARCPDQD